MVSYKTAEMVIQCLRTLIVEQRAAKDVGIETRVLVVDNDSGDAPALEQFVEAEGVGGFIKIIRAERNGGFAYGNNVAFRYAYDSGVIPDYFWLLNPDTEVFPRGLIELVEFMASYPEVGIAGSALTLHDGTVFPYTFRFPTPVCELNNGLAWGIFDKLFPVGVAYKKIGTGPEEADWLPGASMLLRRSVVETIGGMDEAYFLYFEETDYCRRMKEVGFSTYYVPRSVVKHSPGGSTGVTSLTEKAKRRPAYWYESRRRYYHNNFGLPLAIAADAALVCAGTLGVIKRILQGKGEENVPHQIRDVIAHSPLWKKNRTLAAPNKFRPARIQNR